MKEPYEKGVTNRSAPSLALLMPRGNQRSIKQGTDGQGIELRKRAIRAPTPFSRAEGNTSRGDIVSTWPALRSRKSLTRL
jgi:hypothetical protein